MIFHVDLDAFFAAVEQRDNPSLRGKPVIVGGPAKHRGVVAAASYEAREYGLRSGMPLTQAFRLCPRVILVTPNFQKYGQESDSFYEILSSYTPTVETVSIDEAYLSLYGSEQYYGNFEKLGKNIRKKIKDSLGITASIGIATNKTVAKVASNFQKPDGLTYVAKGEEKAFLSPLAIRNLPGIGEKTEARLRQLGVETIGHVAKVSLDKLSVLFGKYGEYLWQAANGRGDEELVTDWQRKTLGAETTFLYDSADADFIEQTVFFLTLRVGFDLRKEEKKAGGLTLKLRTSTFKTKTHQGKLLYHTSNTKLLYTKAKKLLAEAWDGKTPLRLVGISTFALESHTFQTTLFDETPKHSQEVESTVDTIRSKHGFWSLYPGSLLSTKATLKKHAKVGSRK